MWPCTSEGDRMLEREWVHYLVSWNKIDCRAYKNGKLVDVGKSFSSKGTIHGTRLDIGRYGFGKMWLDDLKVWERPLGEEEAYQVYRSGELKCFVITVINMSASAPASSSTSTSTLTSMSMNFSASTFMSMSTSVSTAAFTSTIVY